VTINAPSPGTVNVSANVWLRLAHTAGKEAEIGVFIGESPTDCPTALGFPGFSTGMQLAEGEPSYSEAQNTIPTNAVFQVKAGSHTYYLNGIANVGCPEVEQFYFAGLTAVFYPS
jgi:hypothetical protein